MLVPIHPIGQCSDKAEAARSEELACRLVLFVDVYTALMKVEDLLGIVAEDSQSLTAIPLATTCGIDDEPHLGTAVGRAKFEEVGHPHYPTALNLLDHEAQLLVHVEVMRIGLDISLQLEARIGDLTCRHHPLAGIVLDMEEVVEVAEFGSAES